MNKILNIAWVCLMCVWTLTSCEMKDELKGKGAGETAGTVELGLSSVYNGQIAGRADGVVDNGGTTGNFAPDDVNVDKYTLVIKNTETQETVKEGIIGEMRNEDGSLKFVLPEGKYKAVAYNYDGAEVNVSERPYFMGQQTFSVQAAVTSKVDIPCKLACVEVELHLTEEFLSTFKDDYSIIVDNSDGANMEFTKAKGNVGKKFYFKTPQNKSSMNVSVKATTQALGSFINVNCVITKPADAEGNSFLANGDSFIVNLTPEGVTESHVTIGITVDLTFTEKGVSIKVPAENITFDDGGTTDPEPSADITFEGLPAEYTCVAGDQTINGLKDVHILAPNGIKNLNVTISGAIESLLGMVELPSTFDVCHLDEGVKAKLIGIGLITEDDYTQLNAGTCKDYTFKLGELLVLVPSVVNEGVSTFKLSVSDGASQKGGDIKVTVNPKQ